MKKKYESPRLEIISAPMQCSLLSGSDNPYWKAPEVPEGCESAWWRKKEE